MKYIIFLSVLFFLVACSSPLETTSEETTPLETTAAIEAAKQPGKTYRVKEKFEQDGRFFVSVKDQPGEAGHLVQVEIKDKLVWDAVKKEGYVTFDKAWNVTGVDGAGIEAIRRELERDNP